MYSTVHEQNVRVPVPHSQRQIGVQITPKVFINSTYRAISLMFVFIVEVWVDKGQNNDASQIDDK